MSFFYVFLLLAIGAVGGYMIGVDSGREEGYLDAASEFHKVKR